MGQQRLEKKRNCICINWKVIPGRETTKPKRVVCHPRWAIGAPLSNWAVPKSDNRMVCTLSFVVLTLTTNVTTKPLARKCLAKTAQTKQAITITIGDWDLGGPRAATRSGSRVSRDWISFRRNVVGEYEATQYQNGGSHFSTPPGIIIPTTDIDGKR